MQFTKALQHTIVWKALNTILIFLVNLLLVRIMGADSSGEFFYTIAALSFFILVLSCSIESGITWHGSNNPANIVSLSLYILPWLLLQAFISWWLLRFINVKGQYFLSWLFVITNLIIVYFSALYFAKKWFLSLNLCVFIVNAMVLLALGWIYFYVKEEGQIDRFNWASGIYFGGFLLQAVILMILFFTRSGFKQNASVNRKKLLRKVFIYSGIAFVSNVLFFLVTRIDYYFVQKFCDDIALSNYVQVSKLGQLLILLPSMIATVLFPYSSAPENTNYLQTLQAVCRMITALFIPVALFFIVLGHWLFPWLFGAGFNEMYPAFNWYLPGFYALSLVTLLAAYLAGRAMLIVNLVASFITLIVVIAGDLLLIPLYGINAAAAVSSGAYLLCLAYLLGIYKNKMGCRYTDFLVLKNTDIQLLLSGFKKETGNV